ncbi:MAG: multicopper oxidase family protein [Actinomycetota bacterium]
MPTLRFSPGDTVELDLVNDSGEPVNLHFHGLHVSPSGESDNIFRVVDPATTAHYRLEIPSDHEPGTFWYHSHIHRDSEQQVYRGMSGMMIVDGLSELLPAVLRDVDQRVFALKQVGFSDGEIPIDLQVKRQQLVVNGQLEPALELGSGETELWRIGNISADTFFDVQLRDHVFHVIAEDGWPVSQIREADSLVLPPGKRYDVLVQGGVVGEHELITRKYDEGFEVYPETTLASVTVTGDTDSAPVEISSDGLQPFEDLADVTIAERRRFTFSIQEDGGATTFRINDRVYNHHRVDAEPQLGTVEEWTLRNPSTEQHPFHIHVNDFQVVSVNGEPYDAVGRQDTVIIPIGGEVVIRIPFQDFTGAFVFHCHILFHEDHGMMAIVDVQG